MWNRLGTTAPKQLFTFSIMTAASQLVCEETQVNLGRFELALNVADINASMSFYRRLGFNQIGGSEESGVAVIRGGNCRIVLYAGYIAENLINFRGGDVPAIAENARTEGLTFEVFV
jgi:hypothetical protein